MKKSINITLILFLCYSVTLFGQVLEENNVDEFTGASIKRTSWETLVMNFKMTTYFRISEVNEYLIFELKMMLNGKVFSIGEGQQMMFKMANDEIIQLTNPEHTVTCTGCGAKGFSGSSAQGIHVKYPIPQDSIEPLKILNAIKLRIYTTDGYVEADLNAQSATKIHKAFKLIFP